MFEGAQRLGEDLRADPHRVADLAEAARALLEQPDDQRRAAIANPVEGDPAGAGGRVNIAGVDIFRFDDDTGKIVEHWDVLRQVPEPTGSGNDMISQLS